MAAENMCDLNAEKWLPSIWFFTYQKLNCSKSLNFDSYNWSLNNLIGFASENPLALNIRLVFA